MLKRNRQSRRKRRVRGIVLLTVLFAILALVLFAIALSVADRNEFIGTGVGCALAAIALYPWRRKSQDFSLNESGVVLTGSGLEMPWEKLVDCRINGNRVDPSFAGVGSLSAEFGSREIQLKLTRSEERLDFYNRAWNQIFSNHVPTLDNLLAKVLAIELQRHPPDSVLAAGSIDFAHGVTTPPRVYVAMLLLIICTIAGGAFSQQPTFSIVIAILLIFVLLAVGLLNLLDRVRKRKSRVGNAGLVISPSRFVLQSKALSGEMRWSELKGVELKPNGRKPKILRLKLDGVDVNLLEEYQLPLWYLYQKIQLFRSKYATSPVTADTYVPAPRVAPPIGDDNPYRPPSME